MRISREVKIGFIAVATLGLFIWGLNYLKGKNILKPIDEYYIAYDEVEGLIESGAVYYKGYKVGNIFNIVFDHDNTDRFIVKIGLNEKIRLPLKTKAIPISSSVIATAKDIKLVPYDTNAYYKPGDTLMSETEKSISSYLEPLNEKTNRIMNELEITLQSVNDLVDEPTRNKFKRSISSLEGIASSLKKDLGENGSIHKSFTNIQTITNDLKNSSKDITGTFSNLNEISDSIKAADLKSTLTKLDSALYSTQEILASINEGEGSLGKLLNSDSLYIHLDGATQNLEALLKDLQENPGRYVSISVFGKKND
jgi:phospholipid/cholesterol/gamma-HCH transport system substrate-binding protein